MSVPTTAIAFTQALDPSDTVDFYVEISQGNDSQSILMPDEEISSFVLALSPEAVAAGLLLQSGARAPVREERRISFWLSVDESARGSAIFSGSGVVLGLELTLTSTHAPPRIKQRTFSVRVAQQ